MKRRFTDADIRKIRRAKGTHEEVSKEWKCSRSFVTMVKLSQRRKQKRKRTGGNRYAPRPSRRKYPDEVIEAVRNSKENQDAIALAWGMSQSYVSEIRSQQRRPRKSLS